ncbi:hypothetical protein MKEN_00718500 [Mycena kentingensis (nom. inval.)]|nr:hypothetical protein MKEN_00718500 [Mycena kentingensis (nom. inval.)]
MDPNGFDYKALRGSQPTNTQPFAMLQKPKNSRTPFAFIQTQSRNQTENQQQQPSSSATRRPLDMSRPKQEPNENPAFGGMRQPSHPRPDGKPQSSQLRAFAMGNVAYDENAGQFAHNRFASPSDRYSVPQSPDREHARARSPSLPAEEDYDADDADLSQLMAKRMRDAKLLKTKLAEQRLATAELESRLSSQLAASEATESSLKTRIAELEARETTRRAQAEEEMRLSKAQTTDAERKVQELSTQLSELRVAAKSSVDGLMNKYAELQTYLKELKTEYDASQECLKTISEEVLAIRKDTAESVRDIEASDHIGRSASTRALVDDLQRNLMSSQQVNDILRDKLHLLSAQLVETKERIAELETKREGKIERVEEKLEDLTANLAKQEQEGVKLLAEKMTLESRLTETLERLQQTLDIAKSKELELREVIEKKIALETQLQEERVRVTSLEEVSSNLPALREEKIALECSVKEQTTRIAALQAVQAELVDVQKQNIALQSTITEERAKISLLERDISMARDESTALKSQLEEGASDVVSLKEAHRETSTKLERANDSIRQQELQRVQHNALVAQLQMDLDNGKAQLRSSQEELRVCSEELRLCKEELRVCRNDLQAAKADIQSTLDQSLKAAAKAKEDIHAATLREAVLQEKADQLTERVGKLNNDIARLNSDLVAREEESRRVMTNAAVLQERFDAQTITLKLAKEQSGDLQERLLVTEKGHSAELESTTGKLNVEIAVLREQKTTLQTNLTKMTDDAATQRAGFLAAAADHENKMKEQKELHAKLVEAEARKTGVAEKDAAETKRVVEQLEKQMDDARSEAAELKTKLQEALSAVAAAKNASPRLNGEVIVLQARLEELEAENTKLQNRTRTLQKRYQDGDLSDAEKAFVSTLMHMSQSVHEQEMVAKENELRRSENMVNSHQTRIDSLQSTLARLLKERGKEEGNNANVKSMVDLNVWVSGSFNSPQEQPATVDEKPPAPSAPTAPAKKSSKTKHIGPKSSPGSHVRGLTAIANEEDGISDIESDDEPPKGAPPRPALGKRPRSPVPGSGGVGAGGGDASRPIRRQRTAGTRKADVERKSDDRVPEPTKTKQRKRR